MRRIIGVPLSLAVFLAAPWASDVAHAQAGAGFPNRAVRIVVPATAGGNNDLVARAVGASMAEGLGQSVIIENRPGVSSLVGMQFVAKAAPDGYTILHVSNTFAVAPSLIKNPGYDPIKGFTGISLTGIAPQLLLINPKLPIRSVKELIAAGKNPQKQISYGTQGVGGTAHLAAELFARQAGITMLHVPYKGGSQGLADLLGGQIDIMFDLGSTSLPHVRSGTLRALAVTSAKRLTVASDIPTMGESGLPGYEDILFTGLVTPAGTPADAVARMHVEVEKAVRVPEIRRKFLDGGVELTASASPAEFTEYIKAEYDKKAKLVRDVNIKPE
jgi:tripartite-type tricarboxylate transporter receptor subunit TctC